MLDRDCFWWVVITLSCFNELIYLCHTKIRLVLRRLVGCSFGACGMNPNVLTGVVTMKDGVYTLETSSERCDRALWNIEKTSDELVQAVVQYGRL